MLEALRRKPDASAELVLAADAMVYVSDLSRLLGEVKRVLAVGGLVAFTLETYGGDGVVIGEGLRYAHGAEYVRGAVSVAGLKLLSLVEASPRTEDNKPVQGLVVVARRT
jgi:predicted TPR repeat methyltransferase